MVTQSQLLFNVNRGQLDEQTSSRFASEVVIQCHIEQLIEDSKFLVDASLTELIKALICATRGDSYTTLPHNFDVNSVFLMEGSQHGVSCFADQSLRNVDSGISSSSLPPGGSNSLSCATLPETEVLNTNVSPHDQTQHDSTLHECPPSLNAPPLIQWTGGASNSSYCSPWNTTGITSSDNCRVFCLELLIRVLMHNRDRLASFWSLVRYYLADLLLSAQSSNLLVERIVVGFLRLAICLLRRHEVTSQIFTTLYWLLLNHGEQLLYCMNPSSSLAEATISSSPQANVSSPNLSNPRNTNKKIVEN
ncbi:hypothetical protein MN116_009006 [Schistosoma mekongi]|uniref:Uncharacterized protein n=1 Tax=Schistosoma mekongi TaxID=38744 RepID=A0AAE2D131_SCHME|nr:hypothetical protein MN116_009006 [Schistosoma mekongi]